MMKNVIFFFLLIASGAMTTAKAQNWNEWFKQKKTQKKYLIQQIAALQVYIGYVRKGYDIAQNGLTLIGNIKEGDINLHRDFFSSLGHVNPGIKNYEKVADIIALQIKTVQVYHDTYKKVKGSGQFTADEVNYINRVYERLLDDCSQVVDVLIVVTTDDELKMTDDERLQCIERLYEDMQDSYTFCQSFSKEALLLGESRMREKTDMKNTRKLYNLK